MTTELTNPILEGLDDDDIIWCIEDDENPGVNLCGELVGGTSIPYDEVPDELTCPECRAEERRRETWLYKVRRFFKH